MNQTETTALLAICASFDNRKPSPEAVTAWTAALADLDFVAARDAVVAHYQESREWIMPADVRGRVKRERSARIANDEALELPPHDPDDTALHIRLLREARAEAAEGHGYRPADLVRRSLRELGGPVRRVNELDDAERAAYAEALREQRRQSLAELAAAPAPKPTPPPVFACEHRDADDVCGAEASQVTADGRRPVCDGHAEETTEGAA